METGLHLTRPSPNNPKPSRLDVDCLVQTPYRSLICSLLYLALGTWPDIAFTINHLARFLDCYGFKYWHTAIRVLRYLKGTCTLTVVLGRIVELFLTGYMDTNFSNDSEMWKSVMGYMFSLRSSSILWAKAYHECTRG
jgi:hypothetical protein